MNNNTLTLVARILLAAIFIIFGFFKFSNIGGIASYIGSVGLPVPTILAWLTAIFEVVAGLCILVGFQTKLASWALAAFCIVSALIFHNNFGDQTHMALFMKNFAMAGGFILLALNGPGAMSLDAKRAS